MGMSTEMAPRYLSVNPSGQMTYVLDTTNINLSQVQLAVPASEIVLIQEDNKSISLCESPVLVADVSGDNVNWLGNNVIVLVSQPQEYVVVEQEVMVNSDMTQTWQIDSVQAASTNLTQYVTKNILAGDSDEWAEQVEETSTTTVEDAKCWFRDSLITTAALSTLTTYVQSNSESKSDY